MLMWTILAATTTTAVVWLIIGLVTTVALVAMVIALIRHGILLGRAAMRLSAEVGPIVDEIDGLNPGRHASGLGGRSPPPRS